MSRRFVAASAVSLALMSALALSSCSSSQPSAAPSASVAASSSSSSAAGDTSGSSDVAATTYPTEAEACSAAFKDITAIQSEMSSALTGDASAAAAALKKVSGQVSGIANGMKDGDNKSALKTLAAFYSDYATALDTKDTAKVTALQSSVTTEGDPANAAVQRLGQCVVGK